MARKSSSSAWFVGVLALAAAVAVAALLLHEPTVQHDTQRPSDAADEAPQPVMSLDADAPRAVQPLGLVPPAPEVEEIAAIASGERLAGHITRLADGTPLADVHVRALGRQTRTDHAGAFVLDAVPAGATVVEVVLADEHVCAVDLPAAADRSRLALVADTGWTLTGRLLSEGGGVLAEGWVRVSGRDGPSTAADAGGGFVLRDVRPRDGRAGVANGRQVVLSAGAPWHVTDEQSVRCDLPVRVLDDLDFVLDGAGRIAGRIVVPHGSESDVDVRVPYRHVGVGLDLLPYALRAVREGDGYHVDGVPPGEYMLLAEPAEPAPDAARDGTLPGRILEPFVAVRAGETTLLDLVLPAGASLMGRVLGAAGQPLVGVDVTPRQSLRWVRPGESGSVLAMFPDLRLSAEGAGGESSVRILARLAQSETTTDGEGRYVVGGLPPGEIVLTVMDRRQPGSPEDELEFTLREGEVRRDVDIVLGGALSVAGRLLDAWGRPLSGSVALLEGGTGPVAIGHDDTVTVGDDGAFLFAGLVPGSRRLWASSSGHKSRMLVVEPGGEALRVVLEQALRLSVLVLDAFSDEPVGEFGLQLETEFGSLRNSVRRDDGRYVFDTLLDDVYTLTVTSAGYTEHVIEGVRPALGEGPDLVVRLVPAR